MAIKTIKNRRSKYTSSKRVLERMFGVEAENKRHGSRRGGTENVGSSMHVEWLNGALLITKLKRLCQ